MCLPGSRTVPASYPKSRIAVRGSATQFGMRRETHGDVGFWHFSDMPERPDVVRSRGVKRKSHFKVLRTAFDPGCVKTRLSQGRAELFSQLPSPNRSCQCNRFSTTTKSSRKFYAQVQRRSFHTAWVKLGSSCAQLGSPLRPQLRTPSAGPVRSEKCQWATLTWHHAIADTNSPLIRDS